MAINMGGSRQREPPNPRGEQMSFSDEDRCARTRIQFLFGRPVAFHRCFVKLTGSVHAALMLSQALYWLNPERQGQSRAKEDGWFWKSREEWEAELGLSRWEQETARKQLRHTRFWLEKEKRLEHKIYFSIDFVELEKALEEAARASAVEVSDHLPGSGNPTSGEGGNPTSGEVEIQPSSEVENPPRRMSKSLRRIKEHRLLQRLPETTTSSELAAGLHKLMPNTAWDEDAIPILWNDCRSRAPDCTVDMILQQVSHKLGMKSWNRIQNPVGFLLTSVPKALQAVATASKRREQAQAEDHLASARREAEKRLQHEQELAAWEEAEQAFEALSQANKQDLVNEERRRFLRDHPEYRDRVHLPGWQESFRSKAIKSLLAGSRQSRVDLIVRAVNGDGRAEAPQQNERPETCNLEWTPDAGHELGCRLGVA
jgi:hypothetical protein